MVLTGKPNVGKSSLLNYFLQHDRALVSEIPGTTRDTLEEWISLDGVPLCLIDTAGMRTSSEPIEQAGIDRARQMTQQADLLIWILDAGTGLTPEDFSIAETIHTKPIIPVINKCDLFDEVRPDLLQGLSVDMLHETIYTSIKDNQGLEMLKEALSKWINTHYSNKSGEGVALSLNDRQNDQLIRAKDSLIKACEAIERHLPEDCWIIDLREAYSFLGDIIGENVSDSILDSIFSRFCIGK